ncbi:hypothetical protein H8356DRAFT_474561 [Neocallimastix lanati (nom. inval.)]|nr:hypothetical protein H8356DRAFT_474561 [Neocallimastix sp. JGI-2020a]
MIKSILIYNYSKCLFVYFFIFKDFDYSYYSEYFIFNCSILKIIIIIIINK